MSFATLALMNRLVCEMSGRGLAVRYFLFHKGLPLGALNFVGMDLRRAAALTGRDHSSSEPSLESLVPSSLRCRCFEKDLDELALPSLSEDAIRWADGEYIVASASLF
jgi:hypothetical protein